MDSGSLVWDEARRLLDRQEKQVDALHTRSLAMLSASGVIAGLFAGQFLSEDLSASEISAVVFALVTFGLAAVLVVYIQWPRTYTFSHDLQPWIADLEAGTAPSVDEFTYNLSRDLNDYRTANKAKIDKLFNLMSCVCILVAVQVLAWGVAVIV
jgi:hypothetical protein